MRVLLPGILPKVRYFTVGQKAAKHGFVIRNTTCTTKVH